MHFLRKRLVSIKVSIISQKDEEPLLPISRANAPKLRTPPSISKTAVSLYNYDFPLNNYLLYIDK